MFDFSPLTTSFRNPRVDRAAERHTDLCKRLCSARRDDLIQSDSGGSVDAPARTPRRTHTTTRKPAKSGDTNDGPAPRYSISASSHEGFGVETPDGRRATLAVVDADGNILEAGPGVARQAWTVAIESYRNFLKGEGYLRVLSKPCDQINRP